MVDPAISVSNGRVRHKNAYRFAALDVVCRIDYLGTVAKIT
jgi:hypothetical protein